jgi:hypothetical protein
MIRRLTGGSVAEKRIREKVAPMNKKARQFRRRCSSYQKGKLNTVSGLAALALTCRSQPLPR